MLVKKINNIHVLLAVAAAILIFYYFFNPVESSWMPQCVFHRLTGLQCMGCGSQRVLHALMHGNLKGAWEANAFVLVSLPFLIFLIVVELNRTRFPRLYAMFHQRWMIYTITALLVAWFLFRNITGI